MAQRKVFFLSILALALCTACRSDGGSPPAPTSPSTTPPGPASTSSIAGVVRNAGRGISGVTIKIERQDLQTTSNSSGEFRLTGITSANFTLQFSHPDFIAIAAPFELAPGESRSGVEQDLVRAIRTLRLGSDRLVFGNVPRGQSKTLPFAVHSIGNAPVTVRGITSEYGVLQTSWSGSIAPGTYVSLPVTFTPLGEFHFGTIAVQSDAQNAPLTANFVGGFATNYVLATSRMVWGTIPIGQSATAQFLVYGPRGGLTIRELRFIGDGFSGSWSGTVPEGDFRSIAVTFSPGEARAYSGELRINANFPAGAASTILLSGTGR